jgi:hypothetical protein
MRILAATRRLTFCRQLAEFGCTSEHDEDCDELSDDEYERSRLELVALHDLVSERIRQQQQQQQQHQQQQQQQQHQQQQQQHQQQNHNSSHAIRHLVPEDSTFAQSVLASDGDVSGTEDNGAACVAVVSKRSHHKRTNSVDASSKVQDSKQVMPHNSKSPHLSPSSFPAASPAAASNSRRKNRGGSHHRLTLSPAKAHHAKQLRPAAASRPAEMRKSANVGSVCDDDDASGSGAAYDEQQSSDNMSVCIIQKYCSINDSFCRASSREQDELL